MRLRDAPAWWLAALLAGLYLLLEPPAADLAAQIYRAELFEREGYALWDNGWYAGHHLPAYSLVFPPLGALLGVRLAGALAAVAAAALFERLVGPRRRVAALWFAAGSATLLVTGRLKQQVKPRQHGGERPRRRVAEAAHGRGGYDAKSAVIAKPAPEPSVPQRRPMPMRRMRRSRRTARWLGDAIQARTTTGAVAWLSRGAHASASPTQRPGTRCRTEPPRKWLIRLAISMRREWRSASRARRLLGDTAGRPRAIRCSLISWTMDEAAAA